MAIAIKPSHKGWLHQSLGIPEGQKLTLAELDKAARSKSGKVRKEATFAKNARSWK